LSGFSSGAILNLTFLAGRRFFRHGFGGSVKITGWPLITNFKGDYPKVERRTTGKINVARRRLEEFYQCRTSLMEVIETD
jgi:hypothetical protein